MKSLFVLGDSISIHYGPYLEKNLSGKMLYSRKEGVDEAMADLDIPRGANGGDSSMVLSYLQSVFAAGESQWNYILLNCGLHDVKHHAATNQLQVSIEDYQSNLRNIISLLERYGVQIIWVRTTPVVDIIHNAEHDDKPAGVYRYSADADAYNIVADEIMRADGIDSIDLYAFTKALGEDIYCDHVHFTESVREKQAVYITENLEQYF
ncbi:MAG: SGNH/GDSL hydrolase family protein [Planctomycetes bacterium]|nr:SGNH/GDSL hydrolase family protein [Planctomycetota bacterium]